MKIKELMEMATVAGGIATVETTLGGTQKRVKVAGLEPAEKVMSGKAKKKGPYANSLSESLVKQLVNDLENLSESEFKRKYGSNKSLVEADLTRRGFLGTLGKAATAGAALAAGGKALGQEKRSVNISVEEADNQIKALRNQGLLA